MATGIRNLAAVKVKSEELQIPYQHLLAAFVMEEAVIAISQSEEAENFWLKNDGMLSLESYKRKCPCVLEYMLCTEEELSVRNIIHRMSLIFHNEKRAEFLWKYRVEKEGDVVTVYLSGRIQELTIPIMLRITQNPNLNLKPVKKELRLFLQNNQTISYLQYPIEAALAEHFIKIMKQLELLNDLSSYYIVYELLKKEMNSTRKVTEQIEELAKKEHIAIEATRFEMVCGYQDSPYMKKRWKAYLKKEKKKTPSFEEVMTILISYFSPIWQALLEGGYYLGDWMPEIARFID